MGDIEEENIRKYNDRTRIENYGVRRSSTTPHLQVPKRSRDSDRARRRRPRGNGRGIRRIHSLRRAVRIDRSGIIKVDVQFPRGATELAFVAGTQHIALREIERGGGRRQGGAAETFLGVLEAGVVGAGGLAEGDARLDRHAGAVAVGGAAEEAAVGGFGVAAFRDVAADLLDCRGRDEGCRVVDAQPAAAAADLACVAGAGHVAAREAEGAVGLERVAAVTAFGLVVVFSGSRVGYLPL